MTQTQLVEQLSLTQQMVASYEVGRRRVPVSLLPNIASTLAVSVEDLIGNHGAVPAKRGPAPKLLQQVARIQRLPDNAPLDEIIYRLHVLGKRPAGTRRYQCRPRHRRRRTRPPDRAVAI
ncbi:MAG TPA: helix-turn-helix transcriptional regulator [Steroidobacteraceae bacterium]|nr:helix-turn-helix transcriptional regulator [Steroidobacteraceae bacterium]HQX77514.1 helix-turn-helix transcriptional regulator [Steroidobacteraceae bacterium]